MIKRENKDELITQELQLENILNKLYNQNYNLLFVTMSKTKI